MIKYFSLEELKDIAFILSVDYEMFPHSTKTQFVRECILWFERRKNLRYLVEEIIKQRPEREVLEKRPYQDNNLCELLNKLSPISPRTKVQIIIPKDFLENKQKLKMQLANLLEIDENEIHFIATMPGSIRILLGIPEIEAIKLYELRLPYMLSKEFIITSIGSFDQLDEQSQTMWKNAVPNLHLLTRLIWRFYDLFYDQSG